MYFEPPFEVAQIFFFMFAEAGSISHYPDPLRPTLQIVQVSYQINLYLRARERTCSHEICGSLK